MEEKTFKVYPSFLKTDILKISKNKISITRKNGEVVVEGGPKEFDYETLQNTVQLKKSKQYEKFGVLNRWNVVVAILLSGITLFWALDNTFNGILKFVGLFVILMPYVGIMLAKTQKDTAEIAESLKRVGVKKSPENKLLRKSLEIVTSKKFYVGVWVFLSVVFVGSGFLVSMFDTVVGNIVFGLVLATLFTYWLYKKQSSSSVKGMLNPISLFRESPKEKLFWSIFFFTLTGLAAVSMAMIVLAGSVETDRLLLGVGVIFLGCAGGIWKLKSYKKSKKDK